MRKKRLAFNTGASLVYEVVSIICGFIVPRLILHVFGSGVNGLVNSIAQFLSIISFLDLGVGAVVQSALYKPLARKDSTEISKIMASAQKFFHRIALVLVVYVLFLLFFYPGFVNQDFDWLYTVLLIAAMSVSYFAQYYFGVVNRLLLLADQHGYVVYCVQSVTLILNAVACVLLIKMGVGIHLVELTTSSLFLLRFVFLRWYADRHYTLNRKIQYSGEPIQQKWNGIAQHVASVVLDSTDTIVLTIFSTLASVSVYSVYRLVESGVTKLFLSMTNGIQSLWGELWAKNETENLRESFLWIEWLLHTGTVFVFGCTAVLIVPFVSVYTKGITDANYIQPLFAALITLANAGHCLRLPYNVMILAVGHYKQTQSNYIIAAVVNITVSVLTVMKWGLVGVAIGTMAAMFYQTIWMARYNSKHLVTGVFRTFVKQMGVDALTAVIGIFACSFLSMGQLSFFAWLVIAVETVLIWGAVIIVINIIFYRKRVKNLVERGKKFLINRKRDA